MKKIFRLLLILCPLSLLISGTAEGKQPKSVSIIFDTDMGPDYDDVGALTLLHAFADNGQARIIATLSSTTDSLSVPCIDAINTFYGKPDIPVGAPETGSDKGDSWHAEMWTKALVHNFPHRVKATADVPDAVGVYRRCLVAQPDNSVVVVTVGFLTNLAALLDSAPDEISPLNGMELVRKKVKHLVSMAGKFPEGREFNVCVDPQASQKVFEKWPTRIILSGFEIGDKILTGKDLVASEIANTPAKEVFTICLRQDNPSGRQSWDQTAVLVAVEGVDKYFSSIRGRIVVDENGDNKWVDDPKGKHEYLTWKMPAEEVAGIIETLMMHQPE